MNQKKGECGNKTLKMYKWDSSWGECAFIGVFKRNYNKLFAYWHNIIQKIKKIYNDIKDKSTLHWHQGNSKRQPMWLTIGNGSLGKGMGE